MLLQATFVGRIHFSLFLNNRGLLGEAVEIGTHRGEFAAAFLNLWKGNKFYCIDPWVAGYCDDDPVSKGNREDDLNEAILNLAEFSQRGKFIQEESSAAIRRFQDNSLDFVYIDGNHQKEYFRIDLRLWWEKVRKGGIIAGHDFVCPNEENGGWGRGIQEILLPFAEQNKRDIHIVLEEDNSPWSFYMEK